MNQDGEGNGDGDFGKSECALARTKGCCDALLAALDDSCDDMVMPWIEACDDSGRSLKEIYFNTCSGS
jgi:hypothetical protein